MKKLVLSLIPMLILVGCSTGDETGPPDPTAGNVAAQKQKTENALNNVPPEFRDKARASASQSQGQGYQPPPRK